jgi:hypothetical protein
VPLQVATNQIWLDNCIRFDAETPEEAVAEPFGCIFSIPTVILGRAGTFVLFAGSAATAGGGGITMGRHQAYRDFTANKPARKRIGLIAAGATLGGVGFISVLVAQAGLRPLLRNQCGTVECIENFVLARTIVTDVGMASLGAGLGMLFTAASYRTRMKTPEPQSARLHVVPNVGIDYTGLSVAGRF